jgi:5-methylcytosine-specific restriction endonuclease McrA
MTRKYTRRTDVYYNAHWRKARLRFLKSHPLCTECQRHGYLVAATEVDHVIEHKGDYELFWDTTNWQALCHMHHSQKTRSQMVKSPKLKRGADERGIPLDPRHPWRSGLDK